MHVHITHFIYSVSLYCYAGVEGYFMLGVIINAKLSFCGDIFHCTSLSFPSWCPESILYIDLCFQGTSRENLMMYTVTWIMSTYSCSLYISELVSYKSARQVLLGTSLENRVMYDRLNQYTKLALYLFHTKLKKMFHLPSR